MSSEFLYSSIERAAQRLAGRVVRTPVLRSPMLDKLAGCRVFVKAEALQHTGAFKYRGALNKLLCLDEGALRRGVIAYSAGNHGHAVAAAALAVGCPAVIVLPSNAVKVKVDNCRWWGAEIVTYDPAAESRDDVARAVAAPRGLTLIPPFDDPEVMAGQGTCGLELAEQLRDIDVRPDALLLNCSGGGLASGVTEAMKHTYPGVDPYVVEPSGYDKMARSLLTGTPQANHEVPKTILDGIAGPVAGARPLTVLQRHGAKALSVDDADALQAMAASFRFLKLAMEPGGAASLAAVLKHRPRFEGRNVVLVASGGNVDPAVFERALKIEL